MPDIDVEINGHSYRLACADGQERRILGLAKRLDVYARQAAAQAGGFSELRVLLMAGLMAVDALDEAEAEARWLREGSEAAPVEEATTAAPSSRPGLDLTSQ